MQKLFRVLAIAGLGVGAAWGFIGAAMTTPVIVTQAQKANNSLVPVTLPTTAKIELKDGSSVTGQLLAFNAGQKSLQVGRQGAASKSISLTQVKQVVFPRDALAYRSDGSLIIRGEDNARAEPRTWSNVPVSAFQLKDPKLGQAQVDLKGVLKPLELKGIQSVAVKSVYVMNELQFQSAEKMTIKVNPSDR